MPLVRVEVRNEYGLGAPELYREANKGDPKDVLDGVAVAGLVGILRQLGDLAEFGAEVFHGLQEELMITTSRSHKLVGRVRRIEAALSPVEKAVLAQRSHLHYAYTAGSNWHPRIRRHQNHFLYSDMPQFIMDSYEDCHGLPSLHLLDKFDPGGPGSCLRRYSDPTFFKRPSAGSAEAQTEKNPKKKKSCRIQRKGSGAARSRKVSRDAPFLSHSGRTPFTQPSVDVQAFPFQMVSTFDATLKSDVVEPSNLDSRTGSGYIRCIFNPTYSMQSEGESKESFSSPLKNQSHSSDHEFLKEKCGDVDDYIQINLSKEQTRHSSPCVTWDEKVDRLEEANAQDYDTDENLESSSTNFDLDGGTISLGTASQMNVQLFNHDLPMSNPGGNIQVEYVKGCGAVDFGSAHKMDVQLSHQEVPTSSPGDIQHDYTERDGTGNLRSGDQKDIQLRNHDVPMMKPGDIQIDDIEVGEAVNFRSDQMEVHDAPLAKYGDIQIDDIEVGEAVNFRSDRREVHDAPLAKYGDIQIDDIESETDHYMDALNTIESEPEIDIDFTTEQELHYDKSDDKKIHDGSLRIGMQLPDTPADSCYTEEITEEDKSDDKKIHERSFGIGTQLSEYHSLNLKSDFLDIGTLNNESYGDNAFSISPDTPADSCFTEEITEEDKSDDKKIHERSFGIGTQLSEYHSLNLKSDFLDIGTLNSKSYGNNAISAFPDTPANSCYTEEVTKEDKFNTISFENNSHLLSPQMASLETGHPENADGTNIECVYSKVSSFKCREDDAGMSTSDPESQKPPPGPSNATSVKFWTNGGLLGLEPSKPPDFNVLNALSQDPVSESNAKTSTFGQSSNFEGDGDKGKPDKKENSTAVKWVSNMGSSTSCKDYQQNNFSLRDRSRKYSTVDLNIKAMPAWQENSQSASRMFETDSTLTLNRPNRKLSHAGGNISDHGSRRSSVVEHNNHHKAAYQTFPGKKGGSFEVKSAATSPSSSPPLEHMKISFQPIDGFETSRLKLKFRDGISSCESSKDAFPLFQLVPEPSLVSYSVDLDSDADTFYRSSPSMSDDCLSHHSEMISEQWESGESPSSKDHDLYDALCRISLSESFSSTLENGTAQEEIPESSTLSNPFTENGIDNSRPCCSLDLPSFDSINHHSIKEEQRNCFHENGIPELRFHSAPPPLPPLQWRAMNPYSNDVKNGPVAAHQAINRATDQKLSAATISQQPEPSPIDEDQIIEASDVLKSKHLELQKLNGRKDNQAVNGESMEEKEDFLHQIRAKSFNLRPTVTSKPTVPTGGPANGAVTAILEKANAIRQVVGSDDGEEDENWSDP